jgi:hypothetical protein
VYLESVFLNTLIILKKENSKGKSSFRYGNTENLKGNQLVLCEGIQPKDYSKKRMIISKEPDYKKQMPPVFKFVSISKYVLDCCLVPTRF